MTDFAVFILTHGRPDKVITYNSLKKCGYTGKIIIVIDDEDNKKDEYIEKFESVEIFCKNDIAKKFDTGDLSQDKRTIVYARNACFEIAKKLGIKNFLQLDDDYTTFAYKFNNNLDYKQRPIKSLDLIFGYMLNFLKKTNILSVAMAQNGDFIGGKGSSFSKDLVCKRKAMNTFFCSTDKPFYFFGRINEDVNTYTNLGGRGGLFLTINAVAINQLATQSNKGGMTDVYLDTGTYLKSFFSVMYSPSCVDIFKMGDKHKRLHHRVKWNNAVPVIIKEKYKK